MRKSEKIGKGSLLKSAKNLIVQKKELLSRIENLQFQYQTLLEKHQPQIDEFQAKADELSKEFRRLYSESQEAYSSGDGASAKSLSLEGHVVEDMCKAINNQANALRSELKSILDKIEALRKKADEFQIEIDNTYKKAVAMRNTKISGFGLSGIMDNIAIEEFLDDFPQKIFEKIHTIKFDDKLVGNESATIFGNHHWDERLSKFEIKIYRHISKNGLEATIAHEIGHTIFRNFMTDIQRWQWGEWYQESMRSKRFITKDDPGDREEDFCECFVKFEMNPEYLEKFDQRRYDFISKIYQDIKQGETS